MLLKWNTKKRIIRCYLQGTCIQITHKASLTTLSGETLVMAKALSIT